MLLPDHEIEKAIEDEGIIKNYDEDCIEPSSYDMRVGKRAILSGIDKEIDVEKESGVVIKPGQFSIITTYESLNFPNNLAGHIGVKSYYTRKGLVLLSGLQIDPGFKGVLVLGVYNAAPRKLTLDYLSPFCTIEMHRLTTPVKKPYKNSIEQAKGMIPQIDKDYLRTIETESLSDLSNNVRNLTMNISNLTNMVYKILIPVAVGTLVVLIGTIIAKLF